MMITIKVNVIIVMSQVIVAEYLMKITWKVYSLIIGYNAFFDNAVNLIEINKDTHSLSLFGIWWMQTTIYGF